jgi:cupin superfamily acireductone dioxygenase involved in methionine salvage
MTEYLADVRMMEKFFDEFEVRYVPCLDNRDVDHLAWIAFSRALTPSNVIIEKLLSLRLSQAKAVNEAIEQDLMVIDELDLELAYDWRNLIKMLLENQPPSDDNDEVEHITRKFKQYHLIDGILFQ